MVFRASTARLSVGTDFINQGGERASLQGSASSYTVPASEKMGISAWPRPTRWMHERV